MKNFLLGVFLGALATLIGGAVYVDVRTNGRLSEALAQAVARRVAQGPEEAPAPPGPQPVQPALPAVPDGPAVPQAQQTDLPKPVQGEGPTPPPKADPQEVHPRPEIADLLPLPRVNPSNPHAIQLGPGGRIGVRLFPPDNPWNQDISKAPVDPRSSAIIKNIGPNKTLHPDFGTFYDGQPIGIPYYVVPGNQPRVPVAFEIADESDPRPYPIPPNVIIEGGPKSDGDRHVIVLDRDNLKLYELYRAFPDGRGGWRAEGGAIFDLTTNRLRPMYWTSADAAGLPILPGLIRYDEVFVDKEIRHAIRFTVNRSRKGFVHPARHWASPHTDVNLPPMGMRVRLRADFDVSGFSPECQVILKAMQKYGMIVADNGDDWFISGAPDPRWNDDRLRELKRVEGRNFEVVQMGQVVSEYGLSDR